MKKTLSVFAILLLSSAASSANPATPAKAMQAKPAKPALTATTTVTADLPSLLQYLEANPSAADAPEKRKVAKELLRQSVLNPAKGEAKLAINRMLVALQSDRFGLRDVKGAQDLLRDASAKGLPYTDTALALGYLTGQLDLPVNLEKALEHVNKDTAPRSVMGLTLRAMILSDESSPNTFDLDEAIAAARAAFAMDKDEPHSIGLLSGLLMSKTTDAESVKEGQTLLESWVEERKAKKAAAVANGADK